MSSKITNLLAKRSIFDILMDLWYLPSTSEYIYLIFKPFIYKLPPEEVPLILEDFDVSTRKFFLTKVNFIYFFIYLLMFNNRVL